MGNSFSPETAVMVIYDRTDTKFSLSKETEASFLLTI